MESTGGTPSTKFWKLDQIFDVLLCIFGSICCQLFLYPVLILGCTFDIIINCGSEIVKNNKPTALSQWASYLYSANHDTG